VNIYTHIVIGSTSNGNSELIRTVTMLQSILLPNSTFWGFVYDSNNPSSDPTPTINNANLGTGQLMTLVYPTGGRINYTYNVGEGACNSGGRPNGLNPGGTALLAYTPQIATRAMADAQGNILGTWTYGGGTILSPDGNLTVTKFATDPTAPYQCPAFDAGQSYYEGPSASGKLLKSVAKALTFVVYPGQPYASYPQETATTTTLANGSTSSVQSGYSNSMTFSDIQCSYQGLNCGNVGSYSLPIGTPTTKKYTDFNGSTLKQETTTYEWQTNSAYLAANLLNIPAVTSVLDGSNNVTSQTSYTYDQSTNSYSPGGTRGHNTTITRTLTTSGVSPTIHIGWNASGMKTFIIDADANAGVPNHVNTLLHSIDYSYDPNPLISCNGSLVTSTVNALNQKVTGTYDCNSGLIASFTDANTQTTGVLWDSMKRLWVVTYPQIPDVGIPQTKFHYLDPTNTVTRTILGNPDPTQTLNVIFDGFGREIHRISTDDPGNDTIDTTYDSNGRVGSISNPYRSTPNGTTTYAYDGLNRKTVQTQPDGTTLISCFDGIPSTGQTNCAPNASSILGASWVDSTDETGRHWQHVSDALGRLRAVMEPDHASNVLSLQTDYTYNTLDDLVSVNQIGTSGETPHVRSFTYDSLSRLLCASNPENAENPCPLSAAAAIPANVVSYIYDPNGNVTQKTDARGTWTSYTFDGLNRVLTKAYSDPLTLPATFTYDSTSISNGIGRLASETVMNGAILISKRAPLAYDPLGHITQLSECTPANCTTTPYQVLYGYDLAGNETSSTNGLPSATFNGVTVPSVSLGMAYDETGRLSGVTSSWSDALAHPATLFQANSINSSAPAYSPAGGLENAIVGINSQTSASTATMVRAYDNRLRPLSETDTASAVLTHPATQSYGSISLAGTEQQTNGTPTQATGTITITGAEGTHAVCTNRLIAGQIVQVCNPYPDSGFLTVTINGFVAKGAYGSGSTDPTVAAALAAALNATGTPVVASSTNNVVTMTSIAAGTAANYGYSISNGTDFAGTDSGSTLIGGTAGPVIYDAGTITVTLNGTQASVPYNSASTPQSLASALGTALQSADGGVVMVSPSGSGIGLTSIQTGTAANLTLSCSVTSSVPQFSLPSFPTTCSGLTGGTNTGTSVETAYSYSIPTSGGYAGNGNLLNATDSVTGGWIYTYDNLNRLTAATGASGSYNGTIGVSGITLGWTYDSFGNRLLQSSSSANLPSYTANYSPSNNRLTSTSQAPGGVTYDNAGNVTADGVNTYLYDAEGRVCAVFSRISGYTQYLYDAEGNRVAKGSINTLSCNLSNNAFTLSKSYIYGAKGELLTEMGANGAWDHSNVYADGRLLATYRDSNTYFAFADWLGSKRAQLSAAGSLQTYGSLPFGDDLTPPAPSSTTTTDAAEQHFTGKERDAESGLDYFGARYYASSMGRFTSPDPGKINPKHLLNPQKWNKYAYVLNNPLSMIDPDGMEELWIQYRAYIPQPTVGSVRGDNRGPSTQENASSRASITMHIETDPAKNHGNPLLGFTQSVSDTHNTKGEATPPQLMQAPTASATQDSVTGQVTLNVKMDVASGDAGILQGLGIRSNVNIGVNEAGTQATVQGTVSGSPAFEANFAPQGGPTTNLPIQGASPNPVGFIVRLGGTNQVDKKTDIKQPGQPQ
jgi:RHS repeat-associated protein